MSFPASIFAAATVFASMTATVAATASIARAQAPAPRFKVLVIAELLDPHNADGNEIHRSGHRCSQAIDREPGDGPDA